MTAAHNNMNQITTLGGGGKTRVAGSLDEPGQVSVGIVGQGDKPARMLSGNRFETELDLPAGTSTLQITAADGSANLTNKQYSVVTSPETSRTVTHDADGNQLSFPLPLGEGQGEGSLEWDVWSRLTKITWATGKTTTFHYNALGERTKMVHVDAGVTRTEYFLYDGARPIQRRSGGTATSNIDREYFSGGERRWNTGTGAWVNHHFTRDHLGSVREVLDSSSNLLARYDYAPYGERTTRYEASGYSSDIGFTGHFHLPSPVAGQSEILLAHYRAYDPVLGRWLSQDPIREMGGINLYGYVENSPVDFTDLLGLVNEGTGAGGPPRGGWGAGGSGLGGGGGGGGFRFGGGGGPAPRPVPNTSQPSTVPPQPAVRVSPPSLQSAPTCQASVTRPSSLFTHIPSSGRKFNQMSSRGWKPDAIHNVVNNPHVTRPSTNKASGNSATAYCRKDGHYIVRDNVTGELVQMSDTRFTIGTGPGQWLPDATIQNPFIPAPTANP